MNNGFTLLRHVLSVFVPPVFPENEEKTRLTRVLFYSSLVTLIVSVVFHVVSSSASQPSWPTLIANIIRVAAGIIIIILLRRGLYDISSYFFIGSIWLSLAVSTPLNGGVYSFGFRSGFLLLIFMSSLLLDKRATAFVTVISIAYGLFLAINFPSTEFLKIEFYRHPIRAWMINSFLFIIALVFIWYSLGTIRDSLAKARKEWRERVKTEISFKESEQSYREVFNATNEAIFIIDPSDRSIIDVNETGVRMYGYQSKDELLDRTIIDLMRIDDDFDQRKVGELLKKSLVGEPQVFELHARRKNGELFWTEISLRSAEIRGLVNILAVVRDNSEKRKVELTLRENEHRLKILSDSTFEGIGITMNGIIIEANDQLANMLGCTREEFIGKNVNGFVAPGSMELVRSMVQSGSEEPYEHLAVKKDGTEFWVEVRGKKTTIDGNSARVTVMRDIDLQKRQSVKLDHAGRQLRNIIRSASRSAFITTNLDGIITAFSPGAELMLGYTVDDVVAVRTPLHFHLDSEVRQRADELSRLYGYPILGFEIFVHTARNGFHEEREWTYVRKNGSHLTVSLVVTPIHDDMGKLQGYLGIARDISENKIADEKIRISEAKLKASIENTPNVAIQWYDREGRVLFWNKASENLYGWTSEESVGKTLDQLIHNPEEFVQFLGILRSIEATGDSYGPYEASIIHRNGTPGVVMATAFAIPSEGESKIYVCMDVDITEQKATMAALNISEKRFSTAFNNAPLLMTISTYEEGRFIEVNNRCFEYSGYHPHEIIGKTAVEVNWIKADVRHHLLELLEEHGNIVDMELDLIRKDGKLTHRLYNCEIITINGKRHMLSISLNISDRKAAEQTIIEKEEKYKHLFETAGDAILIMNEEEFVDCNKKSLELFRCRRDQLIGRRPYEFSPLVQPGGESSKELAIQKIRAVLNGQSENFEWLHLRADGTTFDAEVTLNKIYLSPGMQIQAIVRDVSERKRTEEQIRLLAHAVMSTRECICIIDLDETVLYVNEEFTRTYGYSSEEIIGKDVALIRSQINAVRALGALKENLYSEAWHGELMHVKKDGTEFPIHASISAVRGPNGSPEALIGVITDLTEQKRNEEQKRKLEDQLMHAQKMESFGRLAGGIAHDFNNMLTPILGFGELLKKTFAEADPRVNKLQQIIHAAESSKNLVSKLLAFARKQNLEMKRIDINGVIADFQKILSRTLRENIIVETQLVEEPAVIQGDAGQIEQIILNLAVNAMDAMPHGGSLLIETKRTMISRSMTLNDNDEPIAPGEYVLVSVNDTGSGIPQEILQKIFDPFFTTKEKGKGTGLGLSTVYGIVKQHHGYIVVDSRLGSGTTFRIFFPYFSGEIVPQHAVHRTAERTHYEKRTFLVVEDQEQILELIEEVLTDEGYTVHTASSLGEARSIFDSEVDSIDALITDIILPDGNGRQLFEILSGKKPGLKVLFMSSYTEDTLSSQEYLPEDALFIPKPFELAVFIDTVRRLDEA